MKRVLVLGGYGLIGSAVMRHLGQSCAVTGMGRNRHAALASNPNGDWVIRDLTTLDTSDWTELLCRFDVVVNASGALQDGARDNLTAIHETTVARLVDAAEQTQTRIVQISAVGAELGARTEFLRSKARGDIALQQSATSWIILKPALVLSRDAYGGTALLRGAAALPGMTPVLFPDARLACVFIDDLVDAVRQAVDGEIAYGTIADIAAEDTHSLPELMGKIRRWLGFAPAWKTVALPQPVVRLSARLADGLGWLGWRSALRTTSLTVLEEGLGADPSVWNAAGGTACRSLDDTLLSMPATRQDRLFARLYFLLPLSIAVLSVFWCLSGAIAMIKAASAMQVLDSSGISPAGRAVLVYGGALADIALGAAILWRPWAKAAALGMAGLAAAYLAGSVVTSPHLWLDPLGPMIKVLAVIVLSLIVWLALEDR